MKQLLIPLLYVFQRFLEKPQWDWAQLPIKVTSSLTRLLLAFIPFPFHFSIPLLALSGGAACTQVFVSGSPLRINQTETGETLEISKNRKLLLPLGLEGGAGVPGAQGLRAPGRSWNYSFLSLVQGKLLLPRNPTLSDSHPNQNRKGGNTLPLPFSPP